MIVCIEGVLDASTLATCREAAGAGEYRDGRETAGWAARLVKNNLQMRPSDARYQEIAASVEEALRSNEVFMAAALPRALPAPLISKSEAGMGDGAHVDDALMGEPAIRTDLSYTLFLSRPDDYEGGELVLESSAGEQSYKLAPGSLVLYAATYLHHVTPVRSGTRLVVAGWVQSHVRDAAHRELLFELQRARRGVFAKLGKCEEFDLLSRTSHNLLRAWSDA